MKKSSFVRISNPISLALAAVILFLALSLSGAMILIPRAFSKPAEPGGEAALLDGYRHVEVASVSDLSLIHI